MLRTASDDATTERERMPVTGFSLKPTEIRPIVCPVITVTLVWSEALLDATVVPGVLFPSNDATPWELLSKKLCNR